MSNDIMTNQMPKDVRNSLTVQATNGPQTQNRQQVEVEEGKELPPEASSVEVNNEELQQAVEELNDHVQQVQRDLLFSVDDSSGRTVVRVVNSLTEEVVRQMPSEEVLRISRNLKEQSGDLSGLIFKASA